MPPAALKAVLFPADGDRSQRCVPTATHGIRAERGDYVTCPGLRHGERSQLSNPKMLEVNYTKSTCLDTECD